MITKENGHWKPDWSSIFTAIVLIATVVAMHYTAIGRLDVKDVEIEGRAATLEMVMELRLKEVDSKLALIQISLEKLDTKLEAMR